MPGTAPLIKSTLFSASTLTTSKLTAVTFLFPIWPGSFLPLNTHEGEEDAPMEPGLR